MNNKMKSCFSGHVMMHSLFGLGLGLLFATWFTALRSIWLAVILMVLAVVLDMMRKD